MYLFYRSEHNAKRRSHKLNSDGLKMETWIILMNRAERVDEKNSVICLVMFTHRVMVIKMSEMTHFCLFCWLQ